MFERDNNIAAWNLHADFSNVKLNKPVFIPNINKTFTMFNVVGDNHYMYESDQLMFHMKVEILTRDYVTTFEDGTFDNCRICNQVKKLYSSEIPENYFYWNNLRDPYDNGRLLSICKDCYKLSEEYDIQNNIIIKPPKLPQFTGLRSDRFKQITSVIPYAVIRHDDLIFLAQQTVPLQKCVRQIVTGYYHCNICHKGIRKYDICKHCYTSINHTIDTLQKQWLIVVLLPIIKDVQMLIYKYHILLVV
jgi:hypothetical protein